MQKPSPSEYQYFYANYINSVKAYDGLLALEQSGSELMSILKSISEDQGIYRYEAEKWSIKELIQHIIDSEVIFTNRALRIARGDKTPLPGFEQNDYVPNSYADYKSLAELINLFEITRKLTIALFSSFSTNVHTNIGIASGGEVSVRAIAFTISGHTMHHSEILKTRYLK